MEVRQRLGWARLVLCLKELEWVTEGLERVI